MVMTLATDKRKISAYLDEDLKDSAEKLAKGRGMSLSTLVAFLLSTEVREAKQSGELGDD
jgi:antitoxin component of RelBE/YafQ-DinJ toxin-antitoxin module